MAERQNFLFKIKYKFKKFLYLFYGGKFFKKKDMIGANTLNVMR